MIPVQGYEGRKVGVLGLGRSGLAAAAALEAGGAEALLWDDSQEAREAAEGKGFTVTKLIREMDELAALIVSPGIPHLYPTPNPVIEAALRAGVPVDNDIGLFFRSFATPEWSELDVTPKVIAVTAANATKPATMAIQLIFWPLLDIGCVGLAPTPFKRGVVFL